MTVFFCPELRPEVPELSPLPLRVGDEVAFTELLVETGTTAALVRSDMIVLPSVIVVKVVVTS